MPGGMGMGGGMGGAVEPLSRSVCVRKLSPTVSLEELVNEVGVYGAIDSFRIDRERREAYINYVDGHSAAALLEERPTINFPGQPQPAELTWGKKKALAPELAAAIAQGATRNLYIGNLPEGVTQDQLREKFEPAGVIESVRIMRLSGNGYVNYASIESAIQARDHFRGARSAVVFPENAPSMAPEVAEREMQITF